MDIRYSKQATKYLRKLGLSQSKRIMEKVEKIARGEVQGLNIVAMQGGENAYRLRVGNYRVIYEIRGNELVLVVVKVGARGDVYK